MMKKTKNWHYLWLAFFGSILNQEVFAKAPDWYAGVSLNQARLDINGGVLKRSYDAGLFDNRLDGGDLFIGYTLKPWLALESTISTRYMSEFTWRGYGNDLRTNGITASAKFMSSLFYDFGLYAKTGLGYTRSKAEFNDLKGTMYSATKNVVHPNFAAGIEYSFNKKLVAHVGFEYQYKAIAIAEDKYSQGITGLGILYHF